MALETDFYPWVKTRGSLTGLLGADRPRLFYGGADQGAAKPYAVWHLSGQQGTLHMRGVSAIESPRLTVDVYAETGAVARQVMAALDLELHGFRGLMGATRVRLISRQTIDDLPTFRMDAGEALTFLTRGEYVVTYAP